MILRSSIKTPQKYDDLDYQDHNQEEVHQRTPHPEKKMIAYTGRIIEYNPNIRPAVFPTIPLDQEVDEDAWQRSKYSHSQRHAVSGNGSSNPASQRPSRSFDLSSFNHPQMFASTPPSGRRPLENRNFIISPQRTPSPIMRPFSPLNNVEMRNKTLMAEFNERTDEDWNIAEMATSDEDEPENKLNKQALAWDELPIALRLDLVDKVFNLNKNLERTIKALRLTSKQRAEIIDRIAEYNEFTIARNDTVQQVEDRVHEIMLNGTKDDQDWLTKKGGYEQLMDENVYKHVVKFGDLTSTVANFGEVRLAKQYLATCGFSPDLLRSWTKPKIGTIASNRGANPNSKRHATHFPTFSLHKTSCTKQDAEETAYSSDNRSHNNASPSVERSRTPVEAAQQRGRTLLRTTVNVRVSTSQKRSPSGSFEQQADPKRYNRIRVATQKDNDGDSSDPDFRPPMARFSRPKSILKNRNRHHSTGPVVASFDTTGQPVKLTDEELVAQQLVDNAPKVGLSTQANNLHQRQRIPAPAASEPSARGFVNDNARQREAIMRDQHSSFDTTKLQATHQKAYEAPALAKAFVLPPQLSQQQAAWLPDGYKLSNATRRTSLTDRQSDMPRRYDSHGVEIPPSGLTNGNTNSNIGGRINGNMKGNMKANMNGNMSGGIHGNTNGTTNGSLHSMNGSTNSTTHGNLYRNGSPHSSPALPNATPFNGDPRTLSRGANTIPDTTVRNLHNSQNPRQGSNGPQLYGIRQVPNMIPVQGNRPRAPPAQMVVPPSTNGAQLAGSSPTMNGAQQPPRLPSANGQRPVSKKS